MIFGMATGLQLLEGLVFGIFRHLRRYSFITNLMTKPDDVPVSEKHELLTTHSYAPVALRENGPSGYSRLVRLAAFKTLIRVPGPGKIELDAAFSAGEVLTSARKIQVFLLRGGQLCNHSLCTITTSTSFSLKPFSQEA
jgi:hypothetical protein